ncbi:MAG: response regulator transcription factor [Bacteroidales bacterium]|nr:response regulator transcription factor [Bacteroidales bacterium]
MTKKLPQIIIADDHDMFRDALKTMLEFDNIAQVIDMASNGKELIEILKNKQPDIILMDIEMPVLNGIEASSIITQKYENIKIVALSMFGEENYYNEMIKAGAKGFVLKSSNKGELEKAINEIMNGNNFFSNELLMNIIQKIGITPPPSPGLIKKETFTKREIDVIQNLCVGLSTQEIADKLFLSAKTIENYRVKLLHKTGCKNSVSLVVYAIKNNIISI